MAPTSIVIVTLNSGNEVMVMLLFVHPDVTDTDIPERTGGMSSKTI